MVENKKEENKFDEELKVFQKFLDKNSEALTEIINKQQEIIERYKIYIEIYSQQVKNNQIILQKMMEALEATVKENNKNREDKKKEIEKARRGSGWVGIVLLAFVVLLVIMIFKISGLK